MNGVGERRDTFCRSPSADVPDGCEEANQQASLVSVRTDRLAGRHEALLSELPQAHLGGIERKQELLEMESRRSAR